MINILETNKQIYFEYEEQMANTLNNVLSLTVAHATNDSSLLPHGMYSEEQLNDSSFVEELVHNSQIMVFKSLLDNQNFDSNERMREEFLILVNLYYLGLSDDYTEHEEDSFNYLFGKFTLLLLTDEMLVKFLFEDGEYQL